MTAGTSTYPEAAFPTRSQRLTKESGSLLAPALGSLARNVLEHTFIQVQSLALEDEGHLFLSKIRSVPVALGQQRCQG